MAVLPESASPTDASRSTADPPAPQVKRGRKDIDDRMAYRIWAMIWKIRNPAMIRTSTAQFAMYLSHCADTRDGSNITTVTTSTLSLTAPIAGLGLLAFITAVAGKVKKL